MNLSQTDPNISGIIDEETLVEIEVNDKPKYENICFEGGGAKGVAYIGALKKLEEEGLLDNLKNFAGSSVGSMFAGILACRAKIDYIDDKFKELNMEDFLDDSFGIFKDVWRFFKEWGVCPGNYLHNWVGDIIEDVTGNRDITFQQIYEKYDSTLYITGTCLNEPPNTRFFDRFNTPDMPIRDAIRMSTSMPLVFVPYKYNNNYYVDGGYLENYPINVFKNDEEDFEVTLSKTIGLYLASKNEGKPIKLDSLRTFFMTIAGMALDVCSKKHVDPAAWNRTCKIIIDGISSIDFGATAEQKEYMQMQGRDAMIEFLKKEY